MGTKTFKDQDFITAQSKYLKAIRYLDVHNDLPTEPEELSKKYFETLISCLLNSSLCALRGGVPIISAQYPEPGSGRPNPRLAISQSTRVLNLASQSEADETALIKAAATGLKAPPAKGSAKVRELDVAERTKAFYRRALGELMVKEDDEAERDLKEAHRLSPNDGAIKKELETAKKKSCRG